MFDDLINAINEKIEYYKRLGNNDYVDAYLDVMKMISNSEAQKEIQDNYIQIGGTYNSKNYMIITINETDGTQSFIVKRR